MAPKSIWRGPKAQHFTLVHRSQQDPLVNDAEASSRVLKATPKRQEAAGRRSGQSRHELEQALGSVAESERKNVGEAANYGIMFDDTEYDYMQHLRAIGGNDNSRRGGKDEEEDEEVIMLEAPKAQRNAKEKEKQKSGEVEFKAAGTATTEAAAADDDDRLDLPREVLPSQEMMPRTFERDREAGIRPDMDPHLRQILEALEDDAFLIPTTSKSEQTSTEEELFEDDSRGGEDESLDDFFGQIVRGGQLAGDENVPEWRQLPPGGVEGQEEDRIWLDPSARAERELQELQGQGKGIEHLSLEARVALFKDAAAERRQQQGQASGQAGKPQKSIAAPSSVGSQSIFGDKGASRRSRHAGAKARLAASYYAPSIEGGATAFSMSSSAMERNQGLTNLDEQFARMERIYELEDDDDDGYDEGLADDDAPRPDDDTAVGGPQNIDEIFDDFLSKNELIGNRMRQRLGEGQELTSAEKVDLIRRELGAVRPVDRQTWDEAVAAGQGPTVSVEELISRDLNERKNLRSAWDVQTIQTTRTNLENHPRTITAAQSVAPSRISRVVPHSSADDASSKTTDRMARIKIDPRTGLANVIGYVDIGARQERRSRIASHSGEDSEAADEADSASGTESDGTTTELNVTGKGAVLKRDRNESKEQKKERKQAVKEEKQLRKAEKSLRKQQFKSAALQQQHQQNRLHAAAAATPSSTLMS